MPQVSAYPQRALVKVLGIDAMGRVGLAGVSPARLLNVVQGGMINQTQLAPAGSKTRFKGRRLFRFARVAPGEIRFAFHNWYIQASSANPEIAGASNIPVTKAAAVLNGVVVAVTVKGERAFTVPAGAAEFVCDPLYPSDFGLAAFLPGTDLEFRILFDLAAGQNAPASAQTFRPGWSQTYRGAPADLPDDVDATGAMATTGSPDAVNIFMPTCVLGRFATPFPSLLLIGDSIFDRQNDFSGLGDRGGGYAKRAALAAGLPFFAMAQGGRTADHQNASPRCAAILGRFTDAHVQLGTNDIAFGRSVTDVLIPDLRTLWQTLRSSGIGTIVQSTLPPRTADNAYKCTDAAQMTPFPTQGAGGAGFGPGQDRDLFNTAALPAEIGAGAGPTLLFDFAAYCADPAQTWRWKVPAYASTLAAAAASGAASVSLADAPGLLDSLVFEPGVANVDLGSQGGPYVHAVTGSGPFIATLTVADAFGSTTLGTTLGKSHTAGSAIRTTLGSDGTHPTAAVHIAAAASLRILYRQLSG